MSPPLDELILQLLAVAPVERFRGRAQEAVEALEQVVQGGDAAVDAPLFHSGYDHRQCWRSPEAVRLAEERDAVAREQFARRQQSRGSNCLSSLSLDNASRPATGGARWNSAAGVGTNWAG